ncbi:MAG TPA: tetratricopeptide repeat protein [Leptolyngbya sp.]|jgi:tetratricopeptide (TPR) repeat protein|nr:tetratricopeptide repeat protein [Leptolyngbya sp.]
MSKNLFTTSEPSALPPTLSLNSPLVGWGIVLIAFGIALSFQALRKGRTPPASLDPYQPLPFTQSLQWLGYGKQLENAKNLEGAIAVYDQGLEQHPHDFRLWHERGLALAKHQRFEAAIASYDQAYKLRPDCRDLAHERGDALLQLGRYEEAIVSLNGFLRYAPDSSHVLSDRGFALYQLGRYAEALRSLNAAIQSAQRDPNALNYARYYRIESLRQLGQLSAALEACQEAVKQNPQFQAQYEAVQAQILMSS